MVVFDEFGSIRKSENRKYANCNWHNTSYAKTIQGWTSENKNIDNCIKKFQLKATQYENEIEWILFNRLKDFQQTG